MGEADRSPADVDLVELLDEANASASGSPAHDVVATTMATVAAGSTGSGRFVFELNDSLATVTTIVQDFTARPLGQGATWVRFRDPARGTGLLTVIHSPISLPGGDGEADLILIGQPTCCKRMKLVRLITLVVMHYYSGIKHMMLSIILTRIIRSVR